MAREAHPPRIYVLAGANGAGKSSIAGAMLLEQGVEYFNPDEAAMLIRESNPHLSLEQAQSISWHEGVRLLERAIAEHLDYAFETTLGGRTITALLKTAASKTEVRVWYVGLSNADINVARVRARVARGGHDIPEQRIRERYASSLLNVIRLMPHLTELRVYDNSREANPHKGVPPNPELVLHMKQGKIVSSCKLSATPGWAKPIMLSAMQIVIRRKRK